MHITYSTCIMEKVIGYTTLSRFLPVLSIFFLKSVFSILSLYFNFWITSISFVIMTSRHFLNTTRLFLYFIQQLLNCFLLRRCSTVALYIDAYCSVETLLHRKTKLIVFIKFVFQMGEVLESISQMYQHTKVLFSVKYLQCGHLI